MGCFPNGTNPLIPIEPVVRNLVTLEDVTLAGSTETIAIDYTVLFELQMEQWTAHISAIPGTVANGAITLNYIHRTEARQNTILRSVNFAELQVQNLVCIQPFRWKPGDHVVITYPNVDDLSVGTQFMGIEVLP